MKAHRPCYSNFRIGVNPAHASHGPASCAAEVALESVGQRRWFENAGAKRGPTANIHPPSNSGTHACSLFPLQVNRKVGAEPIGKAGAKLSCLSMYSVPPTEKLSVTEFEEYAFDRLRRECPARDTHRPALARLVALGSTPTRRLGRSAQLHRHGARQGAEGV